MFFFLFIVSCLKLGHSFLDLKFKFLLLLNQILVGSLHSLMLIQEFIVRLLLVVVLGSHFPKAFIRVLLELLLRVTLIFVFLFCELQPCVGLEFLSSQFIRFGLPLNSL